MSPGKTESCPPENCAVSPKELGYVPRKTGPREMGSFPPENMSSEFRFMPSNSVSSEFPVSSPNPHTIRLCHSSGPGLTIRYPLSISQ